MQSSLSKENISQNPDQQLVSLVTDVFDIEDVTLGYFRGKGVRLRGRLRLPASEAYEIVGPRFAERGYTALFRRAGQSHLILGEPGLVVPKQLNTRVNVILFILTTLSVIFAGLAFISPPQELTLSALWPGLAFAAGLLAILVAHEMGHYVVARRFGVPISLPYFIPFPLTLFGTMGATEIMQGRPRNRRALLAVGIAGPLSGFILAVPILVLGLALSQVGPLPTEGGYMLEGNSLLYLAVKYLMFGRILPGGGLDVTIHPIVFAGWGGLLVTSLNLIPAGQLDGGHIIYALLGRNSRLLVWPILIGLIVLGTQWWPWYIWVALIYFLGRVYAEPLDDITELTPAQRLSGVLMMVLFALIFIPVPIRVV